jgi:hypothetical protein
MEGAMHRLLRRVRTLNRRDLVVGGGAVGLVVVTILAVFVFFPSRRTARPAASAYWPGRAEQLLGPLEEVPAWQRGRVLVELRHFSPQTAARVQVDDQSAGGIAVDARGTGRGRVLLPAGLAAGIHQLVVEDAGTGNDAAPLTVRVLREQPATVWAGPRPLPKRAALLVASGFTPGSQVTLSLADSGGAPVGLGSARARHDGRFSLLVGIPAAVGKGTHVLVARDGAGRAARATIELR